ncbi:MAG: hypothetical protein RL392_10 [Pseudomonadota bacterium]
MFSDPVLSTVNIILLSGIVLSLIATRMINKANKELQAKNMAGRRSMSRMYGQTEG